MSSPVRRQAIIIANSVAPQLTQPAFRGGVVLRTAQQVGRALEHLPGDYPFDVDLVVDMTAAKARSRVARGSEDCAKSRGLLLVYYFGHARLQGDDVAFAHPSGKKGDRDFLPFEQLLTAISYGGATKVLIILDCCYAGAGAFALARRDFRYCLMACTTDSSRAWYNDNIERPPIGYFTESILDGLSNQEAAVSATNDSINVMTLFRFAQRITKEKTDGRQDALLIGTLDETLTEYSPVPVIISGVTTDAPAKSGSAIAPGETGCALARDCSSRSRRSNCSQILAAPRFRHQWLRPDFRKLAEICFESAGCALRSQLTLL